MFQPQAVGARTATTTVKASYTVSGAAFTTLSWSMTGTGDGSILQPPHAKNYPMTAPASMSDPGSVTIPFQFNAASMQDTTWDPVVSYHTTNGIDVHNPPTLSEFHTTGTNTTNQTYNGKGGQVAIKATVASISKNVKVTVSGANPQACYVSQQLGNLYGGATSTLLDQIAQRESCYQQFWSKYQNYKVPPSALWPKESKGGGHVGLFQVPITYLDAWDWTRNSSTGGETLAQKIKVARNYSNSQVSPKNKSHPGLIGLQGTQLEDDALSAYGGWLAKKDKEHPHGCGYPGGFYWQPELVSGTWQWMAKGCSYAVDYVNLVRCQPAPPTDCGQPAPLCVTSCP